MSEDQQRDDRNRSSLLQDGVAVLLHDLLVTLGVVAFVGLVMFAASGVWPPLIAVESGSMEPHLQKGDFVFVSEVGRYTPDSPQETGVISADVGREIDYRSFGGYGSVIVYSPPGRATCSFHCPNWPHDRWKKSRVEDVRSRADCW